mgnify:CR=1 FL=1
MEYKIYPHDTYRNNPVGIEYDINYYGRVYKQIRKPCPLCGYVVTHEINDDGQSCNSLQNHYLYQCKEHPYRIFSLAKELEGEKQFLSDVLSDNIDPRFIQGKIQYYSQVRDEIDKLEKQCRKLILSLSSPD